MVATIKTWITVSYLEKFQNWFKIGVILRQNKSDRLVEKVRM